MVFCNYKEISDDTRNTLTIIYRKLHLLNSIISMRNVIRIRRCFQEEEKHPIPDRVEDDAISSPDIKELLLKLN